MNSIDQLKGMAPYQRNRIFAFIGIGFFVFLVILGFIFTGSQTIQNNNVVIEFWDPLDNAIAYNEITTLYSKINEGTFVYRVPKDPETYRQELTDALAAGEGPDIYLIKNTWLPMEERRLVEMNNHLPEIPNSEEGILVSPAEVISRFPDVVRFDLTREDSAGTPKIYGLPIYLDTLALYYNEDYFNTHTILEPPSTWDRFTEISKRVRRVNDDNVELAGAALGTAENVEHSVDILNTIMMQAGTKMNDEGGFVVFDNPVQAENSQFYPARDAFQFYTSFSNPNSENYTWNSEESNSIEGFSEGTTAMMIGYASDRDKIKEENEHLNYSIAPLPQPANIEKPVNYANYWAAVVSEQSEKKDIAWDFIYFLTSEDSARIYTENTGYPPALKSLIEEEQTKEVSDISIFAQQAISARSWLQPNAIEVEKLFNNSIKSVISGESSIPEALSEVADRINLLWRNF
ncbi:MAG: extracellular solute-binding protein [Candidatus Spechtbacterales bacterium]|nr:extracellular solute-binding protein [Candidatus Spechtbacterales bacterium]